jgi:hypothetical protein
MAPNSRRLSGRCRLLQHGQHPPADPATHTVWRYVHRDQVTRCGFDRAKSHETLAIDCDDIYVA